MTSEILRKMLVTQAVIQYLNSGIILPVQIVPANPTPVPEPTPAAREGGE